MRRGQLRAFKLGTTQHGHHGAIDRRQGQPTAAIPCTRCCSHRTIRPVPSYVRQQVSSGSKSDESMRRADKIVDAGQALHRCRTAHTPARSEAPARRVSARMSRAGCRFSFNLSFLIFHSVTDSSAGPLTHGRSATSIRSQRPAGSAGPSSLFGPFNWHNLAFDPFKMSPRAGQRAVRNPRRKSLWSPSRTENRRV